MKTSLFGFFLLTVLGGSAVYSVPSSFDQPLEKTPPKLSYLPFGPFDPPITPTESYFPDSPSSIEIPSKGEEIGSPAVLHLILPRKHQPPGFWREISGNASTKSTTNGL